MKRIKSSGEAIEFLMSIPYCNLIKNIDVREKSIYFDWRRKRYKIKFESCSVYSVNSSTLEGCGVSIFMAHLLKEFIIKKRIEES